ncbi:hypothetical protein FQR65_LT03930 [Abscondita terminalis]|nr:hypothetical protein FQR65_LT03930 [Abscondita terminalis]
MFLKSKLLWAIASIVFLSCNGTNIGLPVRVKYQWINIDYQFETPEARQSAIDSGVFVPGNPRPIDVDLYDDDASNHRIFVTTPTYFPGTPATLSVITNNTSENPTLAPYPSWEWHEDAQSCQSNRVLSVFRIQIDECGRLWVLDTGAINFTPTCPPQILAFNLTNNALIHQYEIPSSQLQDNSLLTLPVVDIRDKTCANTFIYVADTRSFSIIVYDVDNNLSWKVSDKTMYPVPDFGTVCVDGSQFELMDGIQGMALSPYTGQDRVLFYHAFSSNTEQWIWTSKLRNATTESNPKDFHLYCGRRNTQSSPMAIDKRGVYYFGLASDTSLNCWNTRTAYEERNIYEIYKNKNTLQYITGLKIITRKYTKSEEIWLANTRVERIASGPSNSSVINFRVQKASLTGFNGCSKVKQAKTCIESFGRCRNCYNCVIKD